MGRVRDFINPSNFEMNYVNNKLNVVNYDEIVLLTEEKIILLKDKKTISIKGKNLSLLKLLDQEILVNGNIKTIEL